MGKRAPYKQGTKKKPFKKIEGLHFLVPKVGLEPTRTQGTPDFESSASTNSATPAQGEILPILPVERKFFCSFNAPGPP